MWRVIAKSCPTWMKLVTRQTIIYTIKAWVSGLLLLQHCLNYRNINQSWTLVHGNGTPVHLFLQIVFSHFSKMYHVEHPAGHTQSTTHTCVLPPSNAAASLTTTLSIKLSNSDPWVNSTDLSVTPQTGQISTSLLFLLLMTNKIPYIF